MSLGNRHQGPCVERASTASRAPRPHYGAPDSHHQSTHWPLPGGSSTVRSLLAGGSGKLSGKPLVVL